MRKISPLWEGHACTIYTEWWEFARKAASWLQCFLWLSLPPAGEARVVLRHPVWIYGAPCPRGIGLRVSTGRGGGIARPGQGWHLGLLGDRLLAPGVTTPQPVADPKPRPRIEVAGPLPPLRDCGRPEGEQCSSEHPRRHSPTPPQLDCTTRDPKLRTFIRAQEGPRLWLGWTSCRPRWTRA